MCCIEQDQSHRRGTLPSRTYTFWWASLTIVRAVQIREMLMMIHPVKKREQIISTSLILFSRFFITIIAVIFDLYYIVSFFYKTLPIMPCADILACCATPSPKFRVEKAVSPSGIIHAARSGTKFKHFMATILAAIR